MEDSHKLEMENSAIEMGFASLIEYNRLVASIDLSYPLVMQRYLNWLKNDGTKEGLLDINQTTSALKSQSGSTGS